MKEIKIIKKGEKQIGIRLPDDIYTTLERLALDHNCSIQQAIIFILNEEIKNYH